MLEDLKTELPKFTCAVCQKDSEAHQLAVYEDIGLLACQICGSITSTPIPDPELVSEYADTSRAAQASPFPNNLEKKHFRNHLRDLKSAAKGNTCIDVKCHNGYRTEIARITAFPNIAGIDSNPYAIEIAKKRFIKPEFQSTTLSEVAKSGEKFDVALCWHGLESTDDPDQYLQDLRNILNDGAVVYFALCDGNHFMIPNNIVMWKEILYPERTFYYSKKGLEVLLKRNGFQIEKRYFRFLPYQNLIVRKK